jgi:hypothetical protein
MLENSLPSESISEVIEFRENPIADHENSGQSLRVYDSSVMEGDEWQQSFEA